MDTKMEFQVSINSRASLEEMVARVSRVLQCEFEPSHAKLLEGAPAFEAEVLGLWITLSHWSWPERDLRNYQLVGPLQDRLEVKWEILDKEEFLEGPPAPGIEGAG